MKTHNVWSPTCDLVFANQDLTNPLISETHGNSKRLVSSIIGGQLGRKCFGLHIFQHFTFGPLSPPSPPYLRLIQDPEGVPRIFVLHRPRDLEAFFSNRSIGADHESWI